MSISLTPNNTIITNGVTYLDINPDGSISIGNNNNQIAINTDGSLNTYLYANDGAGGPMWLRADPSFNLKVNLAASGVTLNTTNQIQYSSFTFFNAVGATTTSSSVFVGNANFMSLRTINSAFTGTVQFQWSHDNTNWASFAMTSANNWPNTNIPTVSSSYTASSATLYTFGSLPPNVYVRLNISAYTSGTITATGFFSAIPSLPLPMTYSANAIRTTLSTTGGLDMAEAGADGRSNTSQGLPTFSFLSGFNATGWDRIRTMSGVTTDTTTGLGIISTGLIGFDGTSYGRIRTVNGITTDTTTGLGVLATGVLGFDGTSYGRLRTMNGITTDTTTGLGILSTGLMGFDGTSYGRIRTVGGVSDGATIGLLAEGAYGWNGAGWDRARLNNIHKYQEYLSLTSGQHLEIWTPASGKKFRLMNVLFSSNYATGARVTLRDSVGGTTTGAANLVTFNFNAKDTTSFQFGPNGYLSYQANNRLAVYNDSGATISVWLTFIGTEE